MNKKNKIKQSHRDERMVMLNVKEYMLFAKTKLG